MVMYKLFSGDHLSIMVYPMVPNEITRTKISKTILNFFSKSKL
jgi:hypothetical protein